VGIGLQLIQQLNLLDENKLIHLVLQNDFLDAFALALLVLDFIHITVAVPDHVVLFELLVKLLVAVQEFDVLGF
jgi:hypothetical protein